MAAAGWAISLGLLKPPPPLKTKQCDGQRLCICGKLQTAGWDGAVMDGHAGDGELGRDSIGGDVLFEALFMLSSGFIA